MKLENQVVSLELAKKLKELGFNQEGIFYWGQKEDENDDWRLFMNNGEIWYDCVLAHTVAELFNIAPSDISVSIGIIDNKRIYFVEYDDPEIKNKSFTDEVLVDALAECICYLAENNLINPKEIKI